MRDLKCRRVQSKRYYHSLTKARHVWKTANLTAPGVRLQRFAEAYPETIFLKVNVKSTQLSRMVFCPQRLHCVP